MLSGWWSNRGPLTTHNYTEASRPKSNSGKIKNTNHMQLQTTCCHINREKGKTPERKYLNKSTEKNKIAQPKKYKCLETSTETEMIRYFHELRAIWRRNTTQLSLSETAGKKSERQFWEPDEACCFPPEDPISRGAFWNLTSRGCRFMSDRRQGCCWEGFPSSVRGKCQRDLYN